MDEWTAPLLFPGRLYAALDVGCRPCPVPPRPGAYAWYFDAEIEAHFLASGLSLPLNVDGNPCQEAVAAVRAD